MTLRSILIANRGEIAVRVARTASEMGIETVAISAEDDQDCLHTQIADHFYGLRGRGVRAYLDGEQILDIATKHGCDAVHPGYGFLSENAEFARACSERGLKFIGPDASHIDIFGDKGRARLIAEKCDVPLVQGTKKTTNLSEMKAFYKSLGKNAEVMIKAVSGGGGRGMRTVRSFGDLADAFARCQSEALAAFGREDLYIEQLVSGARHIEIQIIGDGRGGITHLWDRECTIQRRHQKVVELAPSPFLEEGMRDRMISDAVKLANDVKYEGLGTFEFLLDPSNKHYFMEVNPRIQVEHTVTEEVLGLDLVRAQISVAGGSRLSDIGLSQAQVGKPTGFALQLRINMETLQNDGTTLPSGGVLYHYDLPSGPGIRVDGFAYQGYQTNPNYDSLLAKLIVSTRRNDFEQLIQKAYRAIREFKIVGLETNIPFLQNILCHPDFQTHQVTTSFIEENLNSLIPSKKNHHKSLFVEQNNTALLKPNTETITIEKRQGYHYVPCPMQGNVVELCVNIGDEVTVGQCIANVEAMKMEHEIKTEVSGIISEIECRPNEQLSSGQTMVVIEEKEVFQDSNNIQEEVDLDLIRPDLSEVLKRQGGLLDHARPKAVEKRRGTGQRTARENLYDLLDDGSFIEYGGLAIAAQRARRSVDELIEKSPTDGLITGTGTINGGLFEADKSRCMALVYDYTVFAGTQGSRAHKKLDRMFDMARKWQIPVVLFGEGGGGRPGDTDITMIAESPSFLKYASLSGEVPLVGIVSGYCFAGNAALIGCSDVIIATKNSSMGMAGPAMIEGGGLGIFQASEVGPVQMQGPNGVIDLVVEDEAEAVKVAQQYISYFQGKVEQWKVNDQRLLRHVIPEKRARSYDIREVIEILADEDSVLELRKQFADGMITSLIRIEGQPFGVIANNNRVQGGAIESDGAGKAARFGRLCNALNIPMISLCDTPGFMVGPEAEQTGQVRHFSRMFVAAAKFRVPVFCVVLRKAYGLGALAMTAGSYQATVMTVAWPSGEFGPMGLEGSVRLSHRNELEVIKDPDQRQKKFQDMVDAEYEKGKALNVATYMEFDNVIDPLETRHWVLSGLRSTGYSEPKSGTDTFFVDTW